MRLSAPIASVVLAAVLAPALSGERAKAPRALAEALRDVLDSVLPVPSPAVPRGEPSGDVTIAFSAASKTAAALEEAKRLEQSRDWPRAVELYQRLAAEKPDELCRRGPRLYVPVRAWVEERLASFPPEGLAEYRRSVDGVAERLYRRAASPVDLSRLGALAEQFLLSSRGDDALALLATAWMARGRHGQALRAWQRLLRRCRDTDVDLTAAAAKIAVCLHEQGHPDTAQGLLKRVAALSAQDTRIALAGRAATLAQAAALVAGLPAAAAEGPGKLRCGPERARTWPAPRPARPDVLAWSDVLHTKAEADDALRRRSRPTTVEEPAEYRPPVSVQPAVAGGRAVYPARTGILARDVRTGKLLWECPWPREALRGAAAPPFQLTTRSGGNWWCSTDGERVLCSLPLRAWSGRFRAPRTSGYLVSADLRSGSAGWLRRAGAGLAAPRAGGWFVSPPLVRGERLVVGLRAGDTGQEYHLSCLRGRDGRLLWRRFICGRRSVERPFGYRDDGALFEGMPAESDGLVVACGGDGVIAAAELTTGRLRWLARYDQVSPRQRSVLARSDETWQTPTPVLSRGVVYATPSDSEFLYAIDLGSGRLLWRHERNGHRYLVAAHDDRVYLAGTRATCLSARGAVEWRAELPTPVAGRPALAGRVLHLPLKSGVLFLDTATGAALDSVAWLTWQETAGRIYTADIAAGDLLVAADRLFVVTPFTINVFSPRDPREELARALAAAPDNPTVHYRLGKQKQWEGDVAGAAAAFEKARELATREPGLLGGATLTDVRRRLTACYQSAARRQQGAGQLAAALESYAAAIHHAPARSTRRALRLRVARIHRGLGHSAAAAAAYQQVLADAEPDGRDWRAARLGLDELLRDAGRAPYARFEQAAAASLAGGTTADWRTVAERYPNSLAAPTALLRLAASAGKEGRPAEARLLLHRLAMEYPDSSEAPMAIYRLAAGYAQQGALAMARGALRTLRRKHPRWRAPAKPRLAIPGAAPPRGTGRQVGPPFQARELARPERGAMQFHLVGDAEAAPGAFFALTGGSLECRSAADGTLRWADRPGWIGISIRDSARPGGGVRIMEAMADSPGARVGLRRDDVIVGFDDSPMRTCVQLIAACSARRAGSPARLRVLRRGKPLKFELALGARPCQPDDPQLQRGAFVGVVDDRVVLRRAGRIDALDRATGGRLWSVPIAGSGQADAGRQAAAAPGIVAAADGRGRIVAVDPAAGRALWTRQLDGPTVHETAVCPQGLVVASSRPPSVQVLNPFDGHVAFRAAEPHAAAAPLFALDTGARLCYAMGSTLGGYDLAEQREAWTVRVANFTVARLWVGGARVVAYGSDARGLGALECREMASGKAAWTLSLARGETLRLGHLEADAFYCVCARAGQTTLRRLDARTGKVAWTRVFERQEEVVDWEPACAALCLGITESRDRTRRAKVLALDKPTNEVRQEVDVGPGALASLRRIGRALYAVVEAEPGPFAARRVPAFGHVRAMEPRFRVVRLLGSRSAKE